MWWLCSAITIDFTIPMRLLNRQAFLSTVNSAGELPKDKTAWAPEEQSLLGSLRDLGTASGDGRMTAAGIGPNWHR